MVSGEDDEGVKLPGGAEADGTEVVGAVNNKTSDTDTQKSCLRKLKQNILIIIIIMQIRMQK